MLAVEKVRLKVLHKLHVHHVVKTCINLMKKALRSRDASIYNCNLHKHV